VRTNEARIDLAVIGSGSAAFAAAIAARNQGRRVVMVERGVPGGTCVNVGCVPSKALLAAADARHVAAAAGRFPGLSPADVPVGFPALVDGKDALVEQLRGEKYVNLAAEYGWEIIAGEATFVGDHDHPELEVTVADGPARRLEAAQYLIATGASPWVPPVEGLDRTGYLTSTTAMELDRLPESLLVVGGNAIGLEQAQLFARLGATVTVVEALDRLAPFEEPEISAAVEGVLADEGVAVHTGATVTRVSDVDGSKVVVLRAGDGTELELSAEEVLVATGRRPVTAGLNLEAVGVKTGGRGEVVVDDHLRSSNARVWAAGDVTGHAQFVYVAAAQGTLVADNALADAGRTLDYTALPRVTFTSPAVAAVGVTEAEVVAAGRSCDCRTLPLAHVPRALVNRDTRGLVKIVAETGTGRVLGVHALTEGAGDLITAAGYAIAAGMTVDQLAHGWAPYLTMAEALKLAAQTYTADVGKLSCCAG
jgi:mercuric reductase